MLNILVNKTDFDQSWARETMKDVLYCGVKVVVLPFAHNEGWAMDVCVYEDTFMKDSLFQEDLKRPFLAYGVKDEDICILNTFCETYESCKKKIDDSDVVFIVGSDANDVMDGILDLGIEDVLRGYEGTMIGASAGAVVQMDRFMSEDGYREGLGIVSGIDLDVHYEENEFHLKRIIDSLETAYDQILIVKDKGGILVSGVQVEFIGDAFVFDVTQLDEIYEAYNTYLM